MSIKYSMEVDLFDEFFDNKLASLQFFDILIEMEMWLDGMDLDIKWLTIEMGSASVTSEIIPDSVLQDTDANKHVMDYFNWSFDLILPWLQDSRVQGVNTFMLPKVIPGIIDIECLELKVEKNYLAFGMYPQFLLGG